MATRLGRARVSVHRPIYVQTRRQYGLLHFLFDLFMIAITSGLWLIWMVFRFLRSR